jgi:hypothetical protein
MQEQLEQIDIVNLEHVTGGSRFPFPPGWPERPRCDRPGCVEPSPTFPEPPWIGPAGSRV